MDKTKEQTGEIVAPEAAPRGAVISPDTRREQRIPPGQSRTKKWPVLDAAGPPWDETALARTLLGDAGRRDEWQLGIYGLVNTPVSFTWREFGQLPRVRVFADFHCVTRWSRLGNLWEGVSTRELLARAGGARPDAAFVLAHGYDDGFATNLPLDDFLAEDALIALTHDGEPLTIDHGGPARLIVPRLYAWKSAKWLRGIELLARDQAGFWEANGYHMRGDPWREERYGW